MLNILTKRHQVVFPILFLSLCILLPYWKLTTMQGVVITDDIFISDLMNEGFPFRFLLGKALSAGELPLWCQQFFGGFPFLALGTAGVCYPPNILLFGILDPYVALNLSILMALILSPVGMFLYTREIGAGVYGAIIAGLSFAFCGFMVSHIRHLSMISAVCWFPIALLFLERACKQELYASRASFLRFGLVFGLQTLSGFFQISYYSALVYIPYAIFGMMRAQHPPPGVKRKGSTLGFVSRLGTVLKSRKFIWLAAACIAAAGINAIHIFPTSELVSLSQRSGGVTFEYASNYAYDASNIKTFIYPYVNGDISNASYRGESVFWEDYGYTGIVVLLLAFYGVMKGWKSTSVRFFTITAVVAYLLVLGPNTPLYELAFHGVPGMQFFRFPTRFLFIVDASIAILAALGTTQLLERIGKKRDRTLTVGWALVACVLFDLVFFQLRQNPIVSMKEWKSPPRTAQILQKDSTLFRIYSPGSNETHRSAFAKAVGWQGNLQPYIEQREFLQPSSHVLYGFSTADGYAQLTPNYVVDVWGDQNRGGLIYETAKLQPQGFVPGMAFMNILSMNNIKYVLSPWPFVGNSVELMDTVGGVFLYRNQGCLPRVYCVGSFVLSKSDEQTKALLRSETFRPSEQVVLNETPELAPEANLSATATIEHYGTNEVIVHVTAERNAILVLSDTYYPGWKAEIDGKEAKVLRANHHQRAVSVPQGEHRVRFVFESATIQWGMGITLGTFLVMVIGMIMTRDKKE